MPIQQLGKYQLHEELGRGGYGTVYRATDTVLEVPRAVKVLHPALVADPSFIERFRWEAKFAARMKHPHIVPVYDLGEAEGRFFLAMEYMPAASLKDMLVKDGPLPFERALEITQQLAEALDYIHKQDLIHRDVKPGNILFGEKGNAALTDLGFAKALSSAGSASLSVTGGMIGTPAYMAPEIWMGGEALPQTDVYSLACVFVEVLTGASLFGGEGDSPPPLVMKRHFDPLELPSKWPEGVPDGINAVLDKVLAKEPEERIASPSEFVNVLLELVQEPEPELVEATPEITPPPQPSETEREPEADTDTDKNLPTSNHSAGSWQTRQPAIKQKSSVTQHREPSNLQPVTVDKAWWQQPAVGIVVIGLVILGIALLGGRTPETVVVVETVEITSTPIKIAVEATIEPSTTPTRQPSNTPEPTSTPRLTLTARPISTSQSTNTQNASIPSSGGIGRIAYESGGKIYIMSADGSNQVPITDDECSLGHPSWSPDGERLVVYGSCGDTEGLFTMNDDGSNLELLIAKDKYPMYCPVWSSNGQQLAYIKDTHNLNGTINLYVINSDGLNQRLLLTRRIISCPAWASDGGMLVAYTQTEDGNDDGIFLIGLSGSFAKLFDDGFMNEFAWSIVDTRKLAYTAKDNGELVIKIRNPYGGSPIVLISGDNPSWSPDGTVLAFDRWDSGSYVWVINADGSSLRKLAEGGSPSWGP